MPLRNYEGARVDWGTVKRSRAVVSYRPAPFYIKWVIPTSYFFSTETPLMLSSVAYTQQEHIPGYFLFGLQPTLQPTLQHSFLPHFIHQH